MLLDQLVIFEFWFMLLDQLAVFVFWFVLLDQFVIFEFWFVLLDQLAVFVFWFMLLGQFAQLLEPKGPVVVDVHFAELLQPAQLLPPEDDATLAVIWDGKIES
jgi:hypothetical protein